MNSEPLYSATKYLEAVPIPSWDNISAIERKEKKKDQKPKSSTPRYRARKIFVPKKHKNATPLAAILQEVSVMSFDCSCDFSIAFGS